MAKKVLRKTRREKASSSGKSGDYYLNLVENSKDALYIIDTKTGEFEYLSPSTTEILGFTPEEMMEMGTEGIDERTHPDDLLDVRKKMNIYWRGIPCRVILITT